MLRAIIDGETDPKRLAEMSRRRMCSKIPKLRLALEGRVREHHRYLLARLMEHWEFVTAQIPALDKQIEQQMPLFEETVAVQ